MTPQMQSRFQMEFGFAPRPVVSLRFILETIDKYELTDRKPSRPALYALIEEGILEGKKDDFGCYVVYRDSFLKWLESYAGRPLAA